MDDLEFRRRVLQGETRSHAIELAARDNPQRQRWLKQARAVESELNHGLHQPAPDELAARLKQIPEQSHPPYRTIAAAVLLFTVASLGWFMHRSPLTLDDAVINHIAAEPNSLYRHQPISAASVNLAARRLGYRFEQPQTNVSYIGACAVRGRQALHLTVQSTDSSATLLLLPDEILSEGHDFAHHHLYGRLIPLARGSAAIVSDNQTLLDQLEATTLQQLAF